MKIIHSTNRRGKRKSAHGGPVEPLERSEAVELLERLERLDPRRERELSRIITTRRALEPRLGF